MPIARPLAQSSGYRPGRVRERAGALALTSIVYALILAIVLIFRGDMVPAPKAEDRLTTILLPPPKPKLPVKQETRPAPKPSKFAGVQEVPPPAPALPSIPIEPAAAIVPPVVDLPRTALADAGPASAATGPAAQAGSGVGQAGGGAGKSGGGSGGSILYNAEWQREPTHEELSRYVPSGAPALGWGLIACRTAENFRVTDCRILNEFPAGSGYGRAARAAYRAYRVKPPRVDGEPQIGAWVRINISYYFPSRQY